MGLCRTRNLLGLTVLAAVVAYISYTPYPSGVQHKAFRTALTIAFTLMINTAKVGEYFGFGCYIVSLRNMMAAAVKPTVANSKVEVSVDKMAGIEVLIFRPRTAIDGLLPGLLFLHGGGWTFGSPEMYRDLCLKLAEETGAVVISVNYRMAPEHLFPAAIDDCIMVVEFILENAEKYGVNRHKVGIAGDSAGGNLAMATAQYLAMAKTSDTPSLKCQILVYPVLQAFDLRLPSYIAYKHGPGPVTKGLMIDCILYYLFGETSLFDAFWNNQHISLSMRESSYASYVSKKLLPEHIQPKTMPSEIIDEGNETLWRLVRPFILDPKFSPLMVPDETLALLPPTYLLIAELDVLRDDGHLAAARLRNAKVPLTVSYEKFEEHGFLSYMNFENARKATLDLSNFFKQVMAKT